MSDFTPLREAIDSLAGQSLAPDFDSLRRRSARRGRRRVVVVAASAATVVAASVLAVTGLGDDRGETQPAVPVVPRPDTGPNGWIAVQRDGSIVLVRPGGDLRPLDASGSQGRTAVCPAWSPDGSRLMFGRYAGTPEVPSGPAELVVVAIGADGRAGTPTAIPLNGYPAPSLDNPQPRPCGTWAPDGRWIAFAGLGEVWLVDSQSGTTRRLPNLWPSDIAWRPGTDELAIAGDVGSDPEGRTLRSQVTVHSVSTGESRQLGSVEAAQISWSPDGSSLAYAGGEDDKGELWLADADGANARLLDADMGDANHGIGPQWSPRGDRIAYQRLIHGSGERHSVVVVDVGDGARTFIEAPTVDGTQRWYPRSVRWSPDGTTLLYSAWYHLDTNFLEQGDGVIAVSADGPHTATLITEGKDLNAGPGQTWGRLPR